MNEYDVIPVPGEESAPPAPAAPAAHSDRNGYVYPAPPQPRCNAPQPVDTPVPTPAAAECALTVRERERAMHRTLTLLASGVLLLLLGWVATDNVLMALTGRYWTPLLRLFFNDACLYGVGAPFFLLLTFRVKAEPVPKRSLRFGSWLIAFLIAAFFVETSATVSFNVIDTVTQLLGFHTSDRIQNVSTNVPMWAVFLFNVVIPPLGEEFLFRRCLLDRLRPYGEKSAALISAFAFALFHINAYQFSYTLLLGLLLAYLYLKTGRLRYCSAIHAGVNLVFGVFPELVDRYGNTEWLSRALSNGSFDLSELTGATLWGTLFYACYLLLINGLVIAGLIFFIRKIGRVRWAQGSCHLSGGRTVLRLVRNPFVWIYVSVTVLLALYYLLLSTLS